MATLLAIEPTATDLWRADMADAMDALANAIDAAQGVMSGMEARGYLTNAEDGEIYATLYKAEQMVKIAKARRERGE